MKALGNIDKRIFLVTSLFFIAVFLFIVFAPDVAANAISAVMNVTLTRLGWVYVFAYAFFLVVFLGIGFSRYGKLKLGKPDDKPEYSFFSWMGLLFGAGLGVGLVYFGVTEPVTHFMTAMFADNGTAAAASDAMRQTFFHWSLLPWAGYGIVGLCMAYFSHRRGLPGLISSTLYPLLGKKALTGGIGKAVNIFAVVAMVCGIAMSTGFAATQFVSGLNVQYNVPSTTWVVILTVVVLGIVSVLACASGLAKGIKFISDINLWLVLALLAFALIFGSTLYIISIFFEGMGDMLGKLPSMMFFLDANKEVATKVGFDWVSSWTVFYWAWWCAFVPFVGGFLANISKGRTIRELVLTSVFVPGMLCCIWFAAFGGSAIEMSLFGGSDVAAVAALNVDTSLFVFLQELPIPQIAIPVAMLLILTLIITSVNSATYVIGTFSVAGNGKPTLWNRAFWGAFIVLFAVLFIWIGGLDILRNTAVVLAFPFLIIMIVMVFSLIKDLKTVGSEDVYEPYILEELS
jgi:glycine betaine transporter